MTNPRPKAAIRFFDDEDEEDLKRLKKITRSPGVREWMEDLKGMNHIHFREWMKERGEENYYLFAVCAESETESGMTPPQGFIYLYPRKGKRGVLEVSYARKQYGIKGLMASGLRLVSHKVKRIRRKLGYTSKTRLVAEIDPKNTASERVIQAAGFENTGEKLGKRDVRFVWELNWRKLAKKMREKGELVGKLKIKLKN